MEKAGKITGDRLVALLNHVIDRRIMLSMQLIGSEYDRIQRRKHFRVQTPVGSRMRFTFISDECEIVLINLSLGGAFGTLVKPRFKDHRRQLLKEDQRLFRVNLLFLADGEIEKQNILIRKAEVRRVEKDNVKKIHNYAFEFMVIDAKETKELTRRIYHIHRKALQNRSS